VLNSEQPVVREAEYIAATHLFCTALNVRKGFLFCPTVPGSASTFPRLARFFFAELSTKILFEEVAPSKLSVKFLQGTILGFYQSLL